MSNDFFTLDASKELVKLFDEASRQTGHSRDRVFTDFLTATVCALAGQTMEDEYMDTINRGYTDGKKGGRGIDSIHQAFHLMKDAMTDTGEDILGDVFQGGILWGLNGQFFTPSSVVDAMVRLTVPTERTEEPKTVCDPACGSGRQLLAVGELQPHWEFIGQDVDPRCTMMTAINLGLHNHQRMGGQSKHPYARNVSCVPNRLVLHG